MARSIKHKLTDIEIACGVTLEQVADLLPKVLVRDGRAIVPKDTPPALSASVARCALGEKAVYTGHNQLGQPVYRRQLLALNPEYPGQTLGQSIEDSMRRHGS